MGKTRKFFSGFVKTLGTRLGRRRVLAFVMAFFMAGTMLSTSMPSRADADGTPQIDLFTGSNIMLKTMSFTAVYEDENGDPVVLPLDLSDPNATIPTNSVVQLDFNFEIQEGNSIDFTKEYVYQLPSTVRVNLSAENQNQNLVRNDGSGVSNGTVFIGNDGKLVFKFDQTNLTGQKNVPFEVGFGGSFSGDEVVANNSSKITFPAGTGTFDFNINWTEPYGNNDKDPDDDPTPVAPKAVILNKSGAQIHSDNGENYIEWDIEIRQNGADSIDGDMLDMLPAGLTYVNGSAKLEGNQKYGSTGTITDKSEGNKVFVEFHDVQVDYNIHLKFKTTYDKSLFGPAKITNDTSSIIDNAVLFDPSKEEVPNSDSSTKVTLKPHVISKSSSGKIDPDGTITWTVKINEEHVNLKGAVFKDTIAVPADMKYDGSLTITKDGVAQSPVTLDSSNSSFTYPTSGTFADGDTSTYVLTYKTRVDNYSPSSMNYKNTATLVGDNVDVHAEQTIPMLNLLSKKCVANYNQLTHELVWELVINESGINLGNITVTEDFRNSMQDSSWNWVSALTITSATLDNGTSVNFTESAVDSGVWTANISDVQTKKVLTIVTKVKDEYASQEITRTIKNNANILWDGITNPPTATAESSYKKLGKVELLQNKQGNIDQTTKTIKWTLVFNAIPDTPDRYTIEDILPEGTTLVKDSFKIKPADDHNNEHVKSITQPITVTPATSTESEKFKLVLTGDEIEAYGVGLSHNTDFYITYETKVTDAKKAQEDTTYVNKVNVKGDFYENTSTPKHEVNDKDGSTHGVMGGSLDKTYVYASGSQEVKWIVKVNEAHLDMTSISNPTISDTLADYFDYVPLSGNLYVTKEGETSRTEVPKSKYAVVSSGKKLTVALPDFTSDNECYEFEFVTRFNVIKEALPKKIDNKVDFYGEGINVSKTSNEVQNISYNFAHASSGSGRQIIVYKVDKSDENIKLANAVFDVYMNDRLIIPDLKTDSEGKAIISDTDSTLYGNTLVLREKKAPEGYKEPTPENRDTKVEFTGTLNKNPDGSEYLEVKIENEKIGDPTGSIKIKKTDGTNPLDGATFGLYSDASCTDLIESKETAKVADEDGVVIFGGLKGDASGKHYYVKEIQSPEGYKLPATVHIYDCELTTTGDTVETTYDSSATTPVVTNDKAVGKLSIRKTDSSNTVITSYTDAEFEVYYDSTLNDYVGKIGFTDWDAINKVYTMSNLELGHTYYVREIKAPTGYVADLTKVYPVTIGKASDREDKSYELSIKNEKAEADIIITKLDDSVTPKPLAGAKFKLYDTDTPGYYQVDSSDYEVTTDSNGKATFKDIPFGNYKVIESYVPDGYKVAVIPNNETAVVVNSLEDKNVTITNKKIHYNIKAKKTDGTNPLAGAKFELRRDSDNWLMGTVVTGTDGIIEFKDIDKDNYHIIETEAPDGYVKGGNVEIKTTDFVDPSDGVYTYIIDKTSSPIENAKMNGSIQIQKNKSNVDGSADGTLDGAKFGLYKKSESGLVPVLDDTGKPIVVTSSSGGVAKFEHLKYGTYYVLETETVAPDGDIVYILDDTVYEVEVENDTPVYAGKKYVDGSVSGGLTTLVFDNRRQDMTPPIISFKFKKTDNNGDILPGAEFALYKEDSVGTRILVATAMSELDGFVYFKKVSIEHDSDSTKYYIEELNAPTGYTKSNKTITINGKNSFSGYSAQIEGVDLSNAQIRILNVDATNVEYSNDIILGSIKITKSDADNAAKKLGKAKFTLYKDATCTTAYQVEGHDYVVTTDEYGQATFEKLTVGTYYVKETEAPQGYVINPEVKKVEILTTTPIYLNVEDDSIKVNISKQEVGGGPEIPSAKLKLEKLASESDDTIVTLPDGSTKYEWTSGTSAHKIPTKYLEPGVYKLTEDGNPAGYAYTEDMKFKIEADGTVKVWNGSSYVAVTSNTVVMQDAPISLKITKVDASDSTTKLSGATFTITDDITGNEVYRWVSNSSYGQDVDFTNFIIPKVGEEARVYTIHEENAPAGYLQAKDVQIRISSAVVSGINKAIVEKYDGTNWITVSDISIANEAKTEIYLRKLDSETGKDIKDSKGAIFEIYRNNSGNPTGGVLATVDCREGITAAINTTNLNEGETYIVIEKEAPSGYKTAKRFVFTYHDTPKRIVLEGITPNVSVNYTGDILFVSDDSIKISLDKVDSYGNKIVGAKLQLWCTYDKKITASVTQTVTEKMGDEFISNGSPYKVPATDIYQNGIYTLQEVNPPAGYKTSNPVQFKLNNDYTITEQYEVTGFNPDTNALGAEVAGTKIPVMNNHIVMVDEGTGINLLKVDGNTDEALAGAEFKLSSTDDYSFHSQTIISTNNLVTIETSKFHVGYTYKLEEVSAPTGYNYAEPILFSINSKNELVINGQVKTDRTLKVEDYKLGVYISKVDLTNDEELPGATIQIKKKDGTLVEEFVSGTTKHMIPADKLAAPKVGDPWTEYSITEITAPYGFAVAETVYFALDSEGNVHAGTVDKNTGVVTYATEPLDANTVTMKDAPMFSISKQNLTGDEIPGATITISVDGDDSFEPFSFVSTDKPRYFNVVDSHGNPVWEASANTETDSHKLVTGVTYTLTETNAPKGYAYTESMTFKIEENGDIYVNGKLIDPKNPQAVMVDDAIGVYISKKDITNDDELPGAKIVIKDEAGNEIYSFTSGATEHKIPSEVFTAPAPGTKFTYYSLTELTAPKGYEVAETMYFALDKSGLVYVKDKNGEYVLINDSIITMYDEPSDTSSNVTPPDKDVPPEIITPPSEVTPPVTSSTNISKTPSMGDTAPIKMVVVVEIMSLLGLVLCLVLYRRRKED